MPPNVNVQPAITDLGNPYRWFLIGLKCQHRFKTLDEELWRDEQQGSCPNDADQYDRSLCCVNMPRSQRMTDRVVPESEKSGLPQTNARFINAQEVHLVQDKIPKQLVESSETIRCSSLDLKIVADNGQPLFAGRNPDFGTLASILFQFPVDRKQLVADEEEIGLDVRVILLLISNRSDYSRVMRHVTSW